MSSEEDGHGQSPCMSRRSFILAGGAGVVLASVPGLSQALQGTKVVYPRQQIAKVSDLKADTPLSFRFPSSDIHFTNFLVKLGAEAGLGVGRDKDIVAFNSFCPHMGGMLTDAYNGEHKVAGPCPLHLTTFDLTRHGMVISGHSTQSLPQIILEVDGDNIYATGVLGLVYGMHENQPGETNLVEVANL